MKPKISVIIPTYNSERTLKQCLASISNQTYKNYEVLIINNNSTDNTKQIIKEFEKKSKKIKYIFEKNKGRSSARNSGIKKAKGKIIAMTDSDCIVPKDWIEKLTLPIIKDNENAIVGGEEPAIKNFWAENIQKADDEFIKSNLNRGYLSHIDTKNFAIKSSIMKKNFFNENLKAVVDFELYLRLKNKIKIKFLPEVKVLHYHRSSINQIIKNSFEKGYYAFKTYEIHKKDKDIKKQTSMQSLFLKNIFLYPFKMIFYLSKNSIGPTLYKLINGLSWGFGNLYGKLK